MSQEGSPPMTVIADTPPDPTQSKQEGGTWGVGEDKSRIKSLSAKGTRYLEEGKGPRLLPMTVKR